MADYLKADRTSGGGYRMYPTTVEQDLVGGAFDKGVVVAGSIIGNVIGASISGMRNAARNAQDRKMQDAVDTMEAAFAENDYVQLARLAKDFTRRYPNNPHGYAFLAAALAERKHCDAAINAANQAENLGLPEVEARMLRANAYSNGDRAGKAIGEFSILIRIPEARDVALWNRARLLVEIGDLDLALADINQAISEFPDGLNYSARGHILRERGEYEKALDDYARAYKCDPDWIELLEFRAECYDGLGQEENAARERKQAEDLRTGRAWMQPDPAEETFSSDSAGLELDPGPEAEAQGLITRLFKQGIYLRIAADGQGIDATGPLDPASAEALARLQPIVRTLLNHDDSP
jgi:tetratricopeptide (TPR) repeat protein